MKDSRIPAGEHNETGGRAHAAAAAGGSAPGHRPVRREVLAAGVLFGFGVGAAAIAWSIDRRRAGDVRERPEAAGELGILTVFGQLPSGPIALSPRAVNVLPRPQHLAFQLEANGTGPRILRIELLEGARRAVAHEERLDVPARARALDYVMLLDDSVPDAVQVAVTVEAPHMRPVTSLLRIRLVATPPAPP